MKSLTKLSNDPPAVYWILYAHVGGQACGHFASFSNLPALAHVQNSMW